MRGDTTASVLHPPHPRAPPHHLASGRGQKALGRRTQMQEEGSPPSGNQTLVKKETISTHHFIVIIDHILNEAEFNRYIKEFF